MIEGGRRTEGDLRPYPARGEKAGGPRGAGHMAAGGGAWGFVPSSELGEAPARVPAASWHHGGCLPCVWERLAGVHSHIATPPQQEETGWEG